MRGIENSDWFSNPRLDQIKTSQSKRRRIANFSLRGNQKAPKKSDKAGS